MTLDGRLGRVTIDLVEPLDEDSVERPPEIEEEEEEDAWEELESRISG